jgi:uncharacterized protein DUF932
MSFFNRSRLRPTDTRLIARPGAFLTDEEIRTVAPSAFQMDAHGSRSSRYAPIPTSLVVQGLRREGFDVIQASQSRARQEDRREYTKHMLRLRRVDAKADRAIGDVYPEVVLVNANDGSSRYVLSAGLFRLICLNGMTTSDKTFEPIKITHAGDVVERVIEGTYKVLDESITALDHARAWSEIDLNPREQHAFAESARVLRFGDSEGNVTSPITAAQLNVPRRRDDDRASLWATFNRVQEHVMNGGLRGRSVDDLGRSRRVTSRSVNGIDQDQRLNRALWLLAENMAQAKAA